MSPPFARAMADASRRSCVSGAAPVNRETVRPNRIDRTRGATPEFARVSSGDRPPLLAKEPQLRSTPATSASQAGAGRPLRGAGTAAPSREVAARRHPRRRAPRWGGREALPAAPLSCDREQPSGTDPVAHGLELADVVAVHLEREGAVVHGVDSEVPQPAEPFDLAVAEHSLGAGGEQPWNQR